MSRAAPLLAAALELAAGGWRVHPCAPSGVRAKAPLLPHGHHDASSDPDTIRAWWTRWPAALIGAAVPDSLLVLDIDPRNAGSLETLQDALGDLPATLTAWSGRCDGGRHLYFRRPPGELHSTRLPRGVDLKLNGYCIMPPSLHPATGQPYRWEDREPVPLPARAVTVLRPPARPPVPRTGSTCRANRLGGLVRVVLEADDGTRNRVLYWACRRAIDAGASDLDGLRPLVEAAHTAGLTDPRPRGLTEAECAAQSALRAARVSA